MEQAVFVALMPIHEEDIGFGGGGERVTAFFEGTSHSLAWRLGSEHEGEAGGFVIIIGGDGGGGLGFVASASEGGEAVDILLRDADVESGVDDRGGRFDDEGGVAAVIGFAFGVAPGVDALAGDAAAVEGAGSAWSAHGPGPEGASFSRPGRPTHKIPASRWCRRRHGHWRRRGS